MTILAIIGFWCGVFAIWYAIILLSKGENYGDENDE